MLLKLSEFQIKTYLIMEYGKKYTAEDVASVTGNARAHKSSILNQLVRLNFIDKRRRSKTIYFRKTSGNYEEYWHNPRSNNSLGGMT